MRNLKAVDIATWLTNVAANQKGYDMPDTKSQMITLISAARLFGWKKPANTREFCRRTGLRPVGMVGRASVYDEDEAKAAANKFKAAKEAKEAKEAAGARQLPIPLAENVPSADPVQEIALLRRDVTERYRFLCQQTADLVKIVAAIRADTAGLQDLGKSLTSLRTETGAGYNVLADELNKVKLQLVEYAPAKT